MFFSVRRQKTSCDKASWGVGSKSNAFVDETSNFKRDTIKTHETFSSSIIIEIQQQFKACKSNSFLQEKH